MGEAPPPEVVSLFNDLLRVPRSGGSKGDVEDVCLGFCYDPIAGLGIVYANYRCRYDEKTLSVVCF